MKYNKSSLIVILIIIIFTFSYINSKKYIIEGNKNDTKNDEQAGKDMEETAKKLVDF